MCAIPSASLATTSTVGKTFRYVFDQISFTNSFRCTPDESLTDTRVKIKSIIRLKTRYKITKNDRFTNIFRASVNENTIRRVETTFLRYISRKKGRRTVLFYVPSSITIEFFILFILSIKMLIYDVRSSRPIVL